ncbi:hypothetical protein OBBRIDRAFT_808675 [Obba rivulosa]|uniref:F-box domain-containing protein n=1 Tax=Obba rivulosa TaxID=1052685 RepID=A0A8E2ANI9_9APHY|nr:hypothetical protein OBBRIDRAFT_808675 [Obba rivulosa]
MPNFFPSRLSHQTVQFFSEVGGPLLNLDVLLFILTFLPYHDLIAMMRSCHFLYTQGLKILIRNQPDIVMRGKTAMGFLGFILVKPELRARHLRALSPTFRMLTPKIAQSLRIVLEHAHNLEILSLDECEYLARLDPSIIPAICGLKKLKQINLQGIGETWGKMLKVFDAPLVHADIVIDHPWLLDAAPDASCMLTKCARTLLYLTTNARFRSVCHYDKVVGLELLNNDVRDIGPLIESFPNLQKLTINLTSWWVAKSYLLDASDIELSAIRTQNQRRQQHNSWEKLSYLQGDARSLYVLGLHTRVRLLTLDMRPNYFIYIPPIKYGRAVISDTRPDQLALQIRYGDFEEDDLARLLNGLSLKFLTLDVLIQEEDELDERDIAGLFYMLAEGLADTEITHILIFVSDVDDPDRPMSPVVDALLQRIDLYRGARYFLKFVRHLLYLRISTLADEQDAAWRVVNYEDGVFLDPIPAIGDLSKFGEDLPECSRLRRHLSRKIPEV